VLWGRVGRTHTSLVSPEPPHPVPNQVRPELLAPGADVSILNNSAAQVFSREISLTDAYKKGVAHSRMPGERVDNDFALHYARFTRAERSQLAHVPKSRSWGVPTCTAHLLVRRASLQSLLIVTHPHPCLPPSISSTLIPSLPSSPLL